MTRRLFLTGPSGCGKSTLLRRVMGQRLALAGGFLTERQLNAEGRYAYFYLRRTDNDGTQAIFLDLRHQPPQKDDRVFTELAAQILQERPAFAVLDEIGGMELLLPEFQAALDGFLASGTPCIGVLKGMQNSQALSKTAHLPAAYLAAAESLRRELEADEHTQILELSGWNDPLAAKLVQQWVEVYAHG